MVQELYLHLSLPGTQDAYDPTRAWCRWCLRVLQNLTEDERRRRRRQPGQLPPGVKSTSASRLSPDEEAALHEFERQLQDCVDRVPEQNRMVLNLHLQGRDLKAIAEQLGIPYGTAGSHLSRARSQVRQCLEFKGYHGGTR
jgi:RNA polymerase sigma factor (sigma-70 family)